MRMGRPRSERNKVSLLTRVLCCHLWPAAVQFKTMSGADSQHETPAVESAGMAPDAPQLHDLVPFVAGERIFAVFAEQVEGTAEARIPAALPNAPAAVLGVVCMRGRMMTVLDPIAILNGETFAWPASLPAVIALRGDEQLALAAQSCRDTITIAAEDIQATSQINDDGFESAVLGLARYGGEEITVLRVDRLFAAAVRRKERRRRRI
jgi:chemotaxis signal transduction protein